MAPKRDTATVLAENMVRVLEAQRALGPGSYPLTLRRLAELTDPEASPESVLQAAGKKKPFGERVVAIRPKDLASPIALLEDTEQLVGSSITLEFLLASLCTPTNPTCDAARLKAALPTKLKKPFEAALGRRIEAGDLPSGVSVTSVKGKKALYLDRFPPPPPAEVVLADDLIKVLRMQRTASGGAYPLTLERLLALTRPGADTKLVQAALTAKPFTEKVLIALKKKNKKDRMESPLSLAEDSELLADSPVLLESTLLLTRTDTNQLLSLSDLKKVIVPDLATPFQTALGRRLSGGSLPPTVGRLYQKKKPLLFLLSDVHASRPHSDPAPSTPTSAPVVVTPLATPVSDFSRAFDEAFAQLDRQRGHNFVNLVDLRREIPADRQTFDAALQNLRRTGRYTLSAAEGRDGISPEENAAGIREDGSLLLYVSRRLS
jgi:hypothetical protein